MMGVRWKRRIILLLILMLGLCGCEKTREHEAEDMTGGTENAQIATAEKEEYPALQLQDLTKLQDMDNPAGVMQELYSNMMVQVRAGRLLGSGVIVASDTDYIWIATAGHVVDEREGAVSITFMDGYETGTSDIQRLSPQDLAILKISRCDLVEKLGDNEYDDHGEGYCVAVLSQKAFDETRDGDLVIAMGSRSGVGEDAYTGVISEDYIYLEDFGANMIVAEVNVTPGMSGGGLFDAEGRLLGIICGISDEGEVAVSSIMSILTLGLGE